MSKMWHGHGRSPKPCKNKVFPYASPCILHFGKRVRAWQNIAKRRDQQVKLSQSLQEFPRISKKKINRFETSRAKHIISYHGFHIVLQSSTLSMSSRLHKWIWKNKSTHFNKYRKQTYNKNKKRINMHKDIQKCNIYLPTSMLHFLGPL